MVIEFEDHLVIYELNINVDTAKRVLAHARSLAPGKPITYYITSHNHQDHTTGMRQAVAEGITVVQRKGSETQFREMAEHRAPDYPGRSGAQPHARSSSWRSTHTCGCRTTTQTIDIYAVPQNGHMADAIIVYIPSEKMMMEGDLVSASLRAAALAGRLPRRDRALQARRRMGGAGPSGCAAARPGQVHEGVCRGVPEGGHRPRARSTARSGSTSVSTTPDARCRRSTTEAA